MDTALIVDGVVAQVWRDCDPARAIATGAPEDGDLVEFDPGTAVCGMSWDGEELTAPPITPPRRLIPKSVIQDRLITAGKIGAVLAVLQSSPADYVKWFAPDWPNVYADDERMLEVLAAVGADVEIITAA